MTPESKSGSHALLLQMIEQNDDKHEAGHRRLRRDFTEGMNDVNGALDTLATQQRGDHEMILLNADTAERRKGLSMNHAVILAASVAGGFQVLVALINMVTELLKHP